MRTLYLRHSLKTAAACVAALVFGRALGLPATEWMVISVIVIMASQARVGGTINKGLLRLLGTLVGSGGAALLLSLLGQGQAAVVVSLGLLTASFSYLGLRDPRLSYASTLGAATAAMVLTSSGPWAGFALTRVGEITLGAGMAILVSRLVFPIHSLQEYRLSLAENFDRLAQLLADPAAPGEEAARRALSEQRLMLNEARRERPAKSTPFPALESVLESERRVARLIFLVRLQTDLACPPALVEALRELGRAFAESREVHLDIAALTGELNALQGEVRYDLQRLVEELGRLQECSLHLQG